MSKVLSHSVIGCFTEKNLSCTLASLMMSDNDPWIENTSEKKTQLHSDNALRIRS